MTDQADMEARARITLAKVLPGCIFAESEKRGIAIAMLSYAAEREAAAYARAAEVASEYPSRLDDIGAAEAARGISLAILALGEAKG